MRADPIIFLPHTIILTIRFIIISQGGGTGQEGSSALETHVRDVVHSHRDTDLNPIGTVYPRPQGKQTI